MNNFDFQSIAQKKKEQILKGFVNSDIEKAGGEGSKGGNVIGHTKSGKPIYASRNAFHEKNWTSQDHKDAAYAHLDKETEYAKKYKEFKNEAHASASERHRSEYDRHMSTYSHKKQNEDLDKDEIKKSEDYFEKARHGVYADNAENQRLHRVGQEYGTKGNEEQGGSKKEGSEEENKLAEHAKNASEDALNRAIKSSTDPKIREAAHAELKRRETEEKKVESQDEFNEKNDVSKKSDEELKKMIEEGLNHTEARLELKRREESKRLSKPDKANDLDSQIKTLKNDLKEADKTQDYESFVKKYVNLMSGYGDDAGSSNDESKEKYKIGDIKKFGNYSNGNPILHVRVIDFKTDSGYAWANMYEAYKRVQYSAEEHLKHLQKEKRLNGK